MPYIGIDPGKGGGIVSLSDNGALLAAHLMPLLKSTKGKDEYNLPEIATLIKTFPAPAFFTIEKAQPMPAKLGGGIANYGRGFSFGFFLGLFYALGLPHLVVPPKTWQKQAFAGINHADTKQASIVAAARLWPTVDWRPTPRCKNAHDGLTDAALIADYGRRHHRGTQ